MTSDSTCDIGSWQMIRLDFNYAKQLVLHWSHLCRCCSEQLTRNSRCLLSCDSLFLRLTSTRRNCPLLSFPEHKNGNDHAAFIVDFSSATSHPLSIFSFSLPAESHISFAVSTACRWHPHTKSFQTQKSYCNQQSGLCAVASTPDLTHIWSSLFRSNDIFTMCTNFPESQILTTWLVIWPASKVSSSDVDPAFLL